jgi:SAM-dependent methyltransferase
MPADRDLRAGEARPAWGEGPGVITQDGSPVDVYLRLPYRGELEVLDAHLPPGCTVLELGCGAGRLTRRLLEAGHTVTAVDNCDDMLRHVPSEATKVHCDISELDLGRAFDVVLLASNLINVGDDSMRSAWLAACRRHLAPTGELLFQRFDPAWLRTVEPGSFPSIGDVEIVIERVHRRQPFVGMSIRYTIGAKHWKQHFTARVLDDESIEGALRAAGFGAMIWIDARWGAATTR